MMKRLALFAAVSLSLAGAAVAQAPTSADDCNSKGADVAQKAEEAKLDDTKTAKVEELLTKLDEQCQGSKFAEAEQTLKDLTAAIGK